jgi:hypothetical protein
VPVDARIEKGRSTTHALRRLWDVEQFDRIVAPAPTNGRSGFSLKDATWLLANSPTETIVLKPTPQQPATRWSPIRAAAALSRRRRTPASAADGASAHHVESETHTEARDRSSAAAGSAGRPG